MEDQTDKHFWPSYVDLMTTLFFVMLVLFIVSYYLYSKQIGEYKVKAEERERIEELRKSIERLMHNEDFFIYEEKYKRYKLAQDIEYHQNKYKINTSSIRNFNKIKSQLISTGDKLENTLDYLLNKKLTDSSYFNISYSLIITGRASKEGPVNLNYELSYKRAYYLYKFWKEHVADFDSEEYQEIIDFQISGIGIGGQARFPSKDKLGNDIESKNRCFLIQIIPKIGSLQLNENENEK